MSKMVYFPPINSDEKEELVWRETD